MKKNMDLCHALLQACVNVSELMQKNQYYKHEDLKKALKIACGIVYGNEDNVKLLKIGNHKLHNNTMIFDLPEVITCKYNCPNCYAIKSARIYENTRVMRLYHLLLIDACRHNDDIKNLIIGMMYNQIKDFASKSMGMVFVRLHSSGDIYCNEYLQLILTLVKQCENIKNVKFYTYTKQLDNNKIDDINTTYNNFNIVKSIMHGDNGKNYINYGDIEYLKELKKHVKDVYICSYGTKNQATCMGNCTKCVSCPHVAFIQH